MRTQRWYLAVFIALAICAANLQAAQLHDPTSTGGTGTGTSAAKPYPSGLQTGYGVAGSFLTIANNNGAMSAAGAPAATMYTPNLPTSTTGMTLQTTAGSCAFASNAATTVSCDRGILTVSFTRPVTNPILHFAGIGGQNVSGTSIISSHAVHTLSSSSPAGATLSILPGATNLQVTGAGTIVDLINANQNGTSCATITAPATTLAGCGSVRVNGTVSSLQFAVTMVGTRPSFNAALGNNLTADGYGLTVTVDEDFGDAPASYDTGAAASHIVDGIRLGATIDADNTTVFNTTPAVAPSPNAVAAGADNNGLAGDGSDEDSLATPLPALHTGLIGQTYSLAPSLSNVEAAASVCGWIDFNRNGTFETTERTCNAVATGNTSTTLNWTVPNATVAGRTYVRLRATYETVGQDQPTGRLASGEVEDYMVEIKPAVQIVKSLAPTTDSGRFDLGIGGTAFALAAGNTGTTGVRTIYHSSASGAPDLTIATDITAAPVVLEMAEVATAATTGSYTSTYHCINGQGTSVASGTGMTTNITLPASIIGASANGRQQFVVCTFTNTRLNAALSITKSDGPGVVTYTPGGTATYVLQACNAAGAGAANGAAIVDNLPNGVTLSGAWNCTGSGGATCSAASGGTAGDALVSLSATALPAGGCLSINVPVSFSSNPANY